MAMAMAPHWLDKVIESVIDTEDPAKIAEAIADSDKFQNAIKEGLKNKPVPGKMSGTYAQNVRSSIQKAMASAT